MLRYFHGYGQCVLTVETSDQAREVCRRVIPELERSFSDGQLHRVFNQTGIRKATGLQYFDVREMLGAAL